MSFNDLNLASRPFANLRPLKRTALALWLVGFVLAAVNARNYWNHFSGENRARARALEVDSERRKEAAAVEELEREVAELRLGSLNERSLFVNEKIEQRTFSWSRLFDRLTEALPNDVRLESLTPTFGSERRRRGRGRQNLEPGEVGLDIQGVAKNDEAMLALIDAFFEHRSFRAPDLTRDSVTDDAQLEFELSVVYQPGDEPPAADEAGSMPTRAEAAP